MSDKPKLTPGTPDHLISLLEVYSAQYASYTTLLWQVPALSLTAQAFLLTLALSHGNGISAKLTAAALSAVISAASYALMHDQRGHANYYGELARRVSGGLDLGRYLGGALAIDHQNVDQTDAEAVWTWRGRSEAIAPRAGRMFTVWKGCMLIFLFVDIGIVASVLLPLGAAVGTAAFLAALSTAAILVRARRFEAVTGPCLAPDRLSRGQRHLSGLLSELSTARSQMTDARAQPGVDTGAASGLQQSDDRCMGAGLHGYLAASGFCLGDTSERIRSGRAGRREAQRNPVLAVCARAPGQRLGPQGRRMRDLPQRNLCP